MNAASINQLDCAATPGVGRLHPLGTPTAQRRLRGKDPMRSISTCLGTAASLLGLVVGGCGGGSATPPPESAASAASAPSSYSVDSAEEWASLESSGKVSYDRACGACHPGGAADLGPKLTGLGSDTGTMYVQIREGSGRMKPVTEKRLPESEMKGLFVYLASIGAVSDVQQP